MGFHPGGMFQHPELIEIYLALNVKVATLAKGGKVPLGAVGLIEVKMMNGKDVAGGQIIGVAATLAFVSGRILNLPGNLGPVLRVLSAVLRHS